MHTYRLNIFFFTSCKDEAKLWRFNHFYISMQINAPKIDLWRLDLQEHHLCIVCLPIVIPSFDHNTKIQTSSPRQKYTIMWLYNVTIQCVNVTYIGLTIYYAVCWLEPDFVYIVYHQLRIPSLFITTHDRIWRDHSCHSFCFRNLLYHPCLDWK